MNEREQFESQFSHRPLKNDRGFYIDQSIVDEWRGWKLCAKSKKSELDKANARIVQLERFITDNVYHDEKYDRIITESPYTWLLDHDKAVEVRGLRDLFSNKHDAEEAYENLIESRKSK